MEKEMEAASVEGTAVEAVAVTAYSFGRSGQISNDQMRAIGMVNDQLARSLTHTLGAWLRTQMHVMLAASEQMTYAQFLATVPEPSYVCVLRLEPLGGVGLMDLDLSLAMTMVDILLGGRGVVDKVREVTDIEDMILHSVVEIVVRELNAAWDTAGLQFLLEKRESRERVMRLMAGSERMLCIRLDLQMDGVHGTLNLCLPAVVLNAIHRRLMSVKDQPRRRFEAAVVRVAELMGEARFRVALRLPKVHLRSREIRGLVVGGLLELPVPRYTQAELVVEGVGVCAAIPVGRGEHRAALVQALRAGVESASAARLGVETEAA